MAVALVASVSSIVLYSTSLIFTINFFAPAEPIVVTARVGLGHHARYRRLDIVNLDIVPVNIRQEQVHSDGIRASPTSQVMFSMLGLRGLIVWYSESSYRKDEEGNLESIVLDAPRLTIVENGRRTRNEVRSR